MTIHQIAFSPTGGTRRVSELLCSGIEAKSILTELCVKEEELCLPSIAAGDLVVVSIDAGICRARAGIGCGKAECR